ncbi:M14 family zinc carboxypeptidase [Rheinheimera maricola]|uniref:Peptidase M14 n=1 Tax=Rheinheimera maricola TaxID=2793282 RepID=A0ABS7X7X0_9GAMM|nr:M14 family zinc carboxypeptidase [Rheinheimera maricola]MBZ9611632.1 peptidase M14 [Rheinheimera maricola]
MPRTLIWLLAALFSFTTVVPAMTFSSLSVQQYNEFKQPGLDKPQLVHSDIAPVLAQHKQNPLFRFSQLGQSALATPIWQIDIGTGPVKVLAWSQMHGDESTATAALMDLLNIIAAESQAPWRNSWLDRLSLRLIPMLNPDGAASGARFNSMGIDINRDAKALQTPEGRLLMQAASEFKPDFGLNLHDQNRFYAVGDSNKQATISLLAPAFNDAKDIDDARKKAMQLIGDMRDLMANELPGYLAKYNDTFSWRSFGDTFAGMGISTVLIEAGGHPSDDNRQVARRLTTQLLAMSLSSIASGAYAKQPLSAYQAIPFNRDGGIKDLLINNLAISVNGNAAQVDLALDLDIEGAKQARIRDIGDLSIYGSYHAFNASGLRYQPAKAYRLDKPLTLDDSGYLALLRQGYSHFTGDGSLLTISTALPVLLNPQGLSADAPQRNRSATFLLANDQGVQLALLNGQLLDLNRGKLLNPLGT